MTNTATSFILGCGIVICNAAVENNMLSWWYAVPVVMICAYLAARLLSKRKERRNAG